MDLLKGVTLKLNQDVECVEKHIDTFRNEIASLKDGDEYVLPNKILTEAKMSTITTVALYSLIWDLSLECRDKDMSVTLMTDKKTVSESIMFVCDNVLDGDKAIKLRDYDVDVYNVTMIYKPSERTRTFEAEFDKEFMKEYGYTYDKLTPVGYDTAKYVWDNNLGEVCILRPDGTESMIENVSQFDEAEEYKLVYGISLN